MVTLVCYPGRALVGYCKCQGLLQLLQAVWSSAGLSGLAGMAVCLGNFQ